MLHKKKTLSLNDEPFSWRSHPTKRQRCDFSLFRHPNLVSSQADKATLQFCVTGQVDTYGANNHTLDGICG